MSDKGEGFNWLGLPDLQRSVAAALQFQLSQTEKFSRRQLEQLQLSNLKSLLRHASEHVPYYRGGDYSDVHGWESWRRLPLLNRQTVQDRATELRADIDVSAREGKIAEMRTSGSTGRPVAVLTSERAQIHWRAITLRNYLWQRSDFSQTLATIRHFPREEAMPPGKRSASWGLSTGLLFETGDGVALNSSTDIATQYEWLAALNPGYLLTYPSVLRALAEHNLASSQPLALSGMITMGETLSPDTREYAQRAFGGRVCDTYSCQESGYLALQCPVHDHYHVQSETCLVEVLDENNAPCAPGAMGRVVATHLHNFAMPLIRYDIGDYAVVGDACDCGINLPVLERVVGRTRNLVTYPDGERSWPSYNPMKLMDILPGAQFQLVQRERESLLLRIGTREAVGEDRVKALKQVIVEAMGYPFTISVEQLPAIPRSKSGKYEEFLSEIDLVRS